MRIRTELMVSEAATDQKPPEQVSSRMSRKPKMAYSYWMPVMVLNTMPKPTTCKWVKMK